MRKYVILVENYDQERSRAYILDNKFFNSKEEAVRFAHSHMQSVKDNHWVGNRHVCEDDPYFKEGGAAFYHAMDMYNGMSLSIDIVEVENDNNECNDLNQ